MKPLVLIVSLLLLASCAGIRHTTTTRTDRDSTYIYARQQDSLYRAFLQRDSVYRRDSVYIYEKGDTVIKYVEKTLYKWHNLIDTIFIDRQRVDTIFIARTDSVMVDNPVYIEKTIKWYEHGLICVGKICCITLILWAISLYLKRKF